MKIKKSWLRQNFGSRITTWEQRSDALGLISDVIIDQDLVEILDYWEGCCAYCGVELDELLHFDHAIPLNEKFVDEGIPLNCIANLVPSCPKCNIQKSDKHYEEFATTNTIAYIENWQIMKSEELI